ALEARVVATPVVGGEILDLLDRTREEAAAERAVRDEADAELAAHGQHFLRDVARPQRVLALQGCDRMHARRPPDRARGRLGQPEEAYLALLYQTRHRADRLLDRHVRVDAMLVVKIDVLDAEPLQARVARGRNVLGPPVDAQYPAIGCSHVTELRREHDLVAPCLQHSADQL